MGRAHRVYTRTGDQGETGLVGGQRVPKDDLRIECYGTVDELNSVVGLVRDALQEVPSMADVDALLERTQHRLFDLGSRLATLPQDLRPDAPQVHPEDIEELERAMDAADDQLPPLSSFVLPGGSRVNALLHLARTVCRRAERLVVRLYHEDGCEAIDMQYLNRLSDAFFIWSRQSAVALGHDEILWRPVKASPGGA